MTLRIPRLRRPSGCHVTGVASTVSTVHTTADDTRYRGRGAELEHIRGEFMRDLEEQHAAYLDSDWRPNEDWVISGYGSVLPIAGLPMIMPNRRNDHGFIPDDVCDEARKDWTIHPTVPAVPFSSKQRILRDAFDDPRNFLSQPAAETRFLRFVPKRGFGQFLGGLRQEPDRHFFSRRSTSAKTSPTERVSISPLSYLRIRSRIAVSHDSSTSEDASGSSDISRRWANVMR